MGSAHQYDTDAPMPLREDSPLGPRSVYGATKAAAERALLTMGPALGVDVIAIRGFNLVGPGQRPPFVLPALGTQVLAAANGEADLIHAGGSLDVSRDFTDIRDGVRALRAVAVRGVPGEAYNLCSGIAARLSEILSDLFTLAGTRPVPVDALKPAANDEPSTVAGDNTKLRTATGWQPLIGFRTTLSDILADLSGASESATSSAGR
jgi:GDP-4-dehydro-6-deoxy-D-mannose reductase